MEEVGTVLYSNVHARTGYGVQVREIEGGFYVIETCLAPAIDWEPLLEFKDQTRESVIEQAVDMWRNHCRRQRVA